MIEVSAASLVGNSCMYTWANRASTYAPSKPMSASQSFSTAKKSKTTKSAKKSTIVTSNSLMKTTGHVKMSTLRDMAE